MIILSTSVTGDTLFTLGVTDLGGALTANKTYNTSSNTANSAFLQVSDFGASTLYDASATTTGVNTVIKITAHNTTTKIIEGTFSGTAKNGAGVIKTISAGQFKAQYQ